MAFGDILSGIGGIASAASDAYIGYLNYQNQQDTLDWEKSAQQTTWDREDNSVQRRVADLTAAGLSPVLAAGAGASSSAPIRVTTPQLNIGDPVGKVAALMQQGKNISSTAAQQKANDLQNQLFEKTMDWKMVEAENNKEASYSNRALASTNASMAERKEANYRDSVMMRKAMGMIPDPQGATDEAYNMSKLIDSVFKDKDGINTSASALIPMLMKLVQTVK